MWLPASGCVSSRGPTWSSDGVCARARGASFLVADFLSSGRGQQRIVASAHRGYEQGEPIHVVRSAQMFSERRLSTGVTVESRVEDSFPQLPQLKQDWYNFEL